MVGMTVEVVGMAVVVDVMVDVVVGMTIKVVRINVVVVDRDDILVITGKYYSGTINHIFLSIFDFFFK